ncbi:MAG: hypothetical protein MUP33_01110 [Polaromonas sp.]|nr:hypothetical protein [Polaromonas sp.]
MARLIEPVGTTNRACQPLMVVVVVIWAKAGAPLFARISAGQWSKAGLLRMKGIVARLAFTLADKGLDACQV